MQTHSHNDFEQQHQYGAIIRSLSGEASAQIRDWQLFYRSSPYGTIAPHLQLDHLQESWVHSRGVIDGIGLRLRYSDHALHLSLSPEGMIESLLFEVLEQIRVESICPEHLKGSRQNTELQFNAWIQQFIASGGVESSIGLLLISVFSTVWMKLNSKPMPQLVQDIMEATRAGIAQDIGPLLPQLKAHRHDQLHYAQTVLKLVDLVSGLIAEEYRHNPSIRTKRKNRDTTLLQIEWIPPNTSSTTINNAASGPSEKEVRDLLKTNLKKYTIFNSSYDTEFEAKKKIRPAQLAIYQEELNLLIADQQIPWPKLIRLYQQIFSSNALNQWQTTETEGLIDRRYLNRIATSPLQVPLYQHPANKIITKGKVSLLIDCSGSMKEQRFKIAACVDSLVRILDQSHIQTEVLGYSTNTWQGGRPFKEWRKNGQNPNPGRLNERAHWIFKPFSSNWRRSRAGIAALLRPEIYAESVDGEAILWAAERLLKSDPENKLNKKLILFSDGCPMDRATIEANGEEFLKNHLLQAISWCEAQPKLEIWGCGVGPDLRSAFQNQLSWDQEPNNISQKLQHWAKELKASFK